MERSTNALAELAERIRVMSLWVDSKYENILDKAQRIVEELAWACDNGNEGRPWMDVAQQTIMRCRAIAEE